MRSLRERDPGHEGARRAARAAIAIPVAALVSHLLAGGTQAPAFTLFGAISLLIVADFPGNRPPRALAYAGLGAVGAVLIAAGTLSAPHPWVAVPLCFAVGAGVSLLGLLSEVIAGGQRAALMTFLLPVCAHPVGPVGERLLGWAIALAVCVPAALFLFPPRYGSELRIKAARVCALLADRIDDGTAVTPATELPAAMEALRAEFLAGAFRPIALTAGSRALIRVVSNLQWLYGRVDSGTGAALGPLAPLSVAVLRGSTRVLYEPSAAGAAELATTVAAHRVVAFANYDNDIRDILAAPDDVSAIALGDQLLARRTLSATIGLTGQIVAVATAADTRPVLDRLLGRGMPDTGVADRVYGKRTALAGLRGYLSTRSITVLNSVRTGCALSVALVVTLLLPVQNGVWVALGALSVLRSSAATTRTTAVRAVTGTLIGFVIGAGVIWVVGIDPVVLWTLLPLAAFGSTYVMVVGSFTASQAMFTMMVLIVFNMLNPTGWQVGLTRIEDVVLGAAVGLAVSVLMWPGGAAAAVQRAIDAALTAGSRYLGAAVLRVTRGDGPVIDAEVARLGDEALAAVRSYGDAVRILLTESGAAVDPDLLDTTNRIPRLRTAADLIADIVPPPPGPFAGVRNVLEKHTIALCDRLEGRHHAPPPPMGGQFVTALRAQADIDDPVAVALPLVTAAANVGELELTAEA